MNAMPILAGWLTGEQVPHEIIEQTLTTMGNVLAQHGGEPSHSIQAGAGLIAFSDPAYATPQSKEPPVLDWVPDRRTLVYRRPLTGMHPLFYIENWPDQGNLLFASEIKALFALGVPRRLHLAALDALLRYGFIPAPWTAFANINVVPAGSILRWQHAKVIVNPASDFSLAATQTTTHPLEQIDTLLQQTWTSLQPKHDQFVALSSGSQSSTLATGLASKQTSTPFNVVTLGKSKTLGAKSWQDAQRVADVYALPWLAVTAQDNPEFWIPTLLGVETPCIDTRSLAIHQLLHTVSAETGARVASSGLAAETLLGLTVKQSTRPTQQSKHTDRFASYRQHMLTAPSTQTGSLWSSDALTRLHKEEPWEDTLYAQKLEHKASRFTTKAQRHHYLDLHLCLANRLVQPFQQLATQEHMVIRSPFLHPDIMETFIQIASTLTDNEQRSRVLPTLISQQQLPMPEKSAGIPFSIPAASLMHLTNTEILSQTLASEAIQNRGIFDDQAIQTLRQNASQRKKAPAELIFVFTTQLLASLFDVEGWS
jgi:asparagine synthetase B (glutamine-hydrolysing)